MAELSLVKKLLYIKNTLIFSQYSDIIKDTRLIYRYYYPKIDGGLYYG